MVDKNPENDIEKYSLCDPHGRITESYLRQARHHVSRDGLIIFSICNNSAYEVLELDRPRLLDCRSRAGLQRLLAGDHRRAQLTLE